MSRRRAGIAVCCAVALAGCDLVPSETGDFVDQPFGEAGAPVLELDGAVLGPVMTETQLRLLGYLDLREALPFAALGDEDACLRDVDSSGSSVSFTVDLACRFGATVASGSVDLYQRLVSEEPVRVQEVDVTYHAARVGGLTVDGTEHLRETEGVDGTSVRTLDLVQDGLAFDYRFRLGELSPDTPVFDYVYELEGGAIRVRLTNPVTWGQLVRAFVTGTDGTLGCEIRDYDGWEPGEPARGTCDNGASFGLPGGPGTSR